jgi:hypothetical protein
LGGLFCFDEEADYARPCLARECELSPPSNGSAYKTVIIEIGHKVVDRKRTAFGVLDAEAAKKLEKSGYFEPILKGKYEKYPMPRNGYWTGTATRYKITKAGQKALKALLK